MTLEPCDRCEEILQDFLDRTLTNEEWAEAESHLGDCDYCRRRYRFEETLRRYVKLSAVERMPPGLMVKLEELRGSSYDATGLSSQILRSIDVAGRSEVVAGDEPDGKRSQAFVGDGAPVGATENDRVPALARIRRRDDPSALAPCADHALDRRRRQVWAVREDDDRSGDVVGKGFQATAKRRTRPAAPLGACDETDRNTLWHSVTRELELVRALDDDDLVDRSHSQSLEHSRK